MTVVRTPPATAGRRRKRRAARPAWLLYLACGGVLIAVLATAVSSYYYVQFSRMIDARLHGERERSLPRVYARPVEIRRGQSLTEQDVVNRLNDLGYAQRAEPEAPGEFAIARTGVLIT